MQNKELKQQVFAVIDQHREQIIEIAETIFGNPELGYKEHNTAQLVKDTFEELGLRYQDELALTGVRADLSGQKQKLKVALMGELDAVVCPEHPQAHPETGAAHSCGHHAQIAGMLGAAIGLTRSNIMEHLDGDIAFFALPAEEYVELEYRQQLKMAGKISFVGGKQELLVNKAFEDIDIAAIFHLEDMGPKRQAGYGLTTNGFVGKLIRFQGQEAHAGGAPHLGINALNAAAFAQMAIHANRETFKNEDLIRVHPIVTKGGDLVNIIPAEVTMETYVRGKTMQGIADASAKVNSALQAGALAVGAQVAIEEIPGFLPLEQHPTLIELAKDNLIGLLGQDRVGQDPHGTYSTDLGDLSKVMPVVQLQFSGVTGGAHSKEYQVRDPELAYIISAKAMAAMAIDLLVNKATLGQAVVEEFTSEHTKATYQEIWDNFK